MAGVTEMAEAIRQGDIPGVQLRRRRAIPLAIEEAWTWLAEPEKLARWLGEEAATDGRILHLTAEGRRESAETLEKLPPRVWILAFARKGAGWSHAATRLSLRLHRALGGTEVDIFHEGFHRLPPALCLPVWEDYRRRWEDALRRLSDAVEGKAEPEAPEPPPEETSLPDPQET